MKYLSIFIIFIFALKAWSQKSLTESNALPECERCGVLNKPASDIKPFVDYVQNQDALHKVNNLQKAGFDCKINFYETRVRGFVCRGKLSGYTEPVRIYIPESFDSTAPTRINVFFHGKLRVDTFLENATGTGYGDYGARLKESNNNRSILIIPESIVGVESYNQFSRKPELFLSLVKEVENKADIKTKEITISGHSGAYLVINSLLGYKAVSENVKEVAMYDAIYGPIPNVKNWLTADNNNKLDIAWISGEGSSTEDETRNFLLTVPIMKQNQITQHNIQGSAQFFHMNIMQNAGFAEFLGRK